MIFSRLQSGDTYEEVSESQTSSTITYPGVTLCARIWFITCKSQVVKFYLYVEPITQTKAAYYLIRKPAAFTTLTQKCQERKTPITVLMNSWYQSALHN